MVLVPGYQCSGHGLELTQAEPHAYDRRIQHGGLCDDPRSSIRFFLTPGLKGTQSDNLSLHPCLFFFLPLFFFFWQRGAFSLPASIFELLEK
jgi:hypothetical protein